MILVESITVLIHIIIIILELVIIPIPAMPTFFAFSILRINATLAG